MTPAPQLTTDEYLRTPETLRPQELIYGALRVADAPTPRHQATLFEFAIALHQHVKATAAGRIWIAPIDVILDRDRALIVQPDLIFVSDKRRSIVTDRVWGAPDMVLEVLSPHPRIGRIEERVGWFASYGVRECWLLHQIERRLAVLTLANGGVASRELFDERTPIRSAVLPGFDEKLASILEW